MAFARDKCFGKAVEKLKDNGKLKDLAVKDQQRWVQDAVSKARSQSSDIWYKVVGAVSRLKKFLGAGGTASPGDTGATRIPDMTLTPDGGKPLVVDNKFDGDSWQDNGQQDSYNDINKQQNGDPKAKDLQLNSAVCKCGEPGAMDPVPVRAPSMSPMLSPMPPSGVGVGAGAGEAAGEAATGAAGTGLGGIGELVFP
jgi:hypothetical protein